MRLLRALPLGLGLALLAFAAPAGLLSMQKTTQVISGGGGDVTPTYSPLFTWSAAGGISGEPVTGFASNNFNRMTYSTGIPGPFGGSGVGQQFLEGDGLFWGGNIIENLSSLDIGEGDDIWIRFYHYFPEFFCFTSGELPPPPDGPDRWGNIKWLRMEYTNGTRYTQQIGSLGGTPIADSPTCGSAAGWGGFTSEYGGDQNKETSSSTQITRGTWLALQFHVHLSSNPALGYTESWIGDTYMGIAVDQIGGENRYLTMPAGGQPIDFLVFGDYWNGSPHFDQQFYFDEWIITTETPNTVDSGGRPYIAPGTQVSDFPGVAAALFTDDFEIGDFSHMENNIRWNGSTSNVTVQTTLPNEGTRSARFRFGPDALGTAPVLGSEGDESWSELRGLIGTTGASGYDEIWIRYAMHVPSNYTHSEASRPNQIHGYNNKGWFYAWDGGDDAYGAPHVGMGPNLWPNSNFDASYNAISEFSFYVWGSNTRGDYHYFHDGAHLTQVLQPAITTADLGQWMDICARYKYATSANNDGVAQIWKKPGQSGPWIQLLDIQNGDWYSAGQTGWDVFYLLGYANSGFTDQTDLYIDNVKIGDADICGVN